MTDTTRAQIEALVARLRMGDINTSLYAEEAADAITRLSADLAAARGALTEIARQKKTDELETEYDVEVADFEGGYDAAIEDARAALSQTQARKGEETA